MAALTALAAASLWASCAAAEGASAPDASTTAATPPTQDAAAPPEGADLTASSQGVETPPAASPESASPPPAASLPSPPPTISEAIGAGKLIFEVRPRYEGVSQANLAARADAFTIRTHLGWETGEWNGFKGLIEFANVSHLGPVRYNTTINGLTAYPIIADPDVTQVNRLQLSWTPSSLLTATVGRQRILIDDQRFVGNANWRQDEQTFDSVKADATYGRFKASYIYIWRVNRIYAGTLDWASDSHLVNVSYTVADPLRLEAFYYALRFSSLATTNPGTTFAASIKAAAAASTDTYGFKLSGKAWVSLYQIAYNATYAHETGAGANPGHFGLDYWAADVAGTFDIYTLKASYEQLDGDGVRGFATPLATLHAFQGWADVFLTTPVNGIRDANISFTVKPRFKFKYFYNTEWFVRYHQFYAEHTSGGLGSEWDLQMTAAVTPKLTGLVKFADYLGVPGFPSRNKVWVGLEFKF